MNTKLKEVFSGKVVNKAHTIELTYDESEVHNKKVRLDEFIEKRSQFTTDEWIDVLGGEWNIELFGAALPLQQMYTA